MCRLALFNADAVLLLGQDMLEEMFYYLDDRQGGDGMGVASLDMLTGKTRIHKAVDMGPLEAAQWVMKQFAAGADWFVFHCRMATTGSIKTANCHPFRHDDLVLAHNGQCAEFGGIDDRTDSEGACLTLARTGLPTTFLENVSGVFVGFRDGYPFVVKGQARTSLEYGYHEETQATLFASEIPAGIDSFFDKVYTIDKYTWLGRKQAGTSTRGGGKGSYYDNIDWETYDWDSWYTKRKAAGTKWRKSGKYRRYSPRLAAKLAEEALSKKVTVTTTTTSNVSYLNGQKVVTGSNTNTGQTVSQSVAAGFPYIPCNVEKMHHSPSFYMLLKDVERLALDSTISAKKAVYQEALDDLYSCRTQDDMTLLRMGWREAIEELTPNNRYLYDTSRDTVRAYETLLALSYNVDFNLNMLPTRAFSNEE